MLHGSKLHIPPTNGHLAVQQEPYKKAQLNGPLAEKWQDTKTKRTSQKNKRWDRKGESTNSPEIPDRGVISDIPSFPLGACLHVCAHVRVCMHAHAFSCIKVVAINFFPDSSCSTLSMPTVHETTSYVVVFQTARSLHPVMKQLLAFSSIFKCRSCLGLLTINCSTVRGKVAEYSKICRWAGRWAMMLSSMPLKSWDSSLSAWNQNTTATVTPGQHKAQKVQEWDWQNLNTTCSFKHTRKEFK